MKKESGYSMVLKKRLQTKNGLTYLFVVFLRLVMPVSVFFYPLFAIVANTILDLYDGEFAGRGVLTKNEYQEADKILDFWWHTLLLFYVYLHFKEFFPLMLLLFIYRMLGYALFIKTKKRWLFVLFPSFFVNLFLLIFFANYVPAIHFLIEPCYFLSSLVSVGVLKLIQEFFLHFFQLSIREDIFRKRRMWAK